MAGLLVPNNLLFGDKVRSDTNGATSTRVCKLNEVFSVCRQLLQFIVGVGHGSFDLGDAKDLLT
jgi:hypothetical protein